MPAPAMSNAGGLAVVTETEYGAVVETPTWTGIPILQEGINAERPTETDNQIYGSCEVQQETPLLEEDGGNFSHRANPTVLPLLLKYLFGGITSGALAGSITATPTATPSSGGTLPDGDYRFVVVAQLTHTASGKKFLTNPSPEATATAGAGDNTIGVSWVNPVSFPPGCTLDGVWTARSSAGGASNTIKLLAFTAAPGTSYSNSDTTALTAVPLPDSVYQHVFAPPALSPGVHRLGSFNLVKRLDVAESQLFTGCRMDKLAINAGGTNEPIELQWDFRARKAETVANPSLAPAVIAPLMGFQAIVLLDGVSTPATESFKVEISNGLTPLAGFSGEPFYRDFSAGLMMFAGDMALSFEGHAIWNKMRAGTTFSFLAWIKGDGTTPTVVASSGATSWPYGMVIDLPKGNYQKAAGNMNQAERMTEQPDFKFSRDITAGYTGKLTVYNKTASYT